MKKYQSVIVLIVLIFSVFVSPYAHAAKPRVRKTTAPRAPGVAYSSAKLSRGTNSVVLTFLNLSKVKSVTYTLSYVASGIPQGAVGTLAVTGQQTDSRDLYFGTCSHGVCTAHSNLKNVTILVSTRLQSGATHTKRYRIKV